MDTAAFLQGFHEKLAESVKQKLVNYPLEEPEVTVKKKQMDQSPAHPDDKERCKEAYFRLKAQL